MFIAELNKLVYRHNDEVKRTSYQFPQVIYLLVKKHIILTNIDHLFYCVGFTRSEIEQCNIINIWEKQD